VAIVSWLAIADKKCARTFAERTSEHRGKGALALIAEQQRDLREWSALAQQWNRTRQHGLLTPLRKTYAELTPE
jgi:hypothetical protein